jgi:hypothetical protein
MAVVTIRCPRTGSFVSTGTEIEPHQFDKLGPKIFRIRCSDCGSEHLWSRGTAWLTAQATPPLPASIGQVPLLEQVQALKSAPPIRPIATRPNPRGHVSQIIERLLGNDVGSQSTAAEPIVRSLPQKKTSHP